MAIKTYIKIHKHIIIDVALPLCLPMSLCGLCARWLCVQLTSTTINQRNKIERPPPIVANDNPCIPSPCGPYSICREIGYTPACSCLPNYVGRAPNCRPECTISSECPAKFACINERCIDPCPGSCGFSAICNVVNHSPVCSCLSGYTGDPFSGCHPVPSKKRSSLVFLSMSNSMCVCIFYSLCSYVVKMGGA